LFVSGAVGKRKEKKKEERKGANVIDFQMRVTHNMRIQNQNDGCWLLSLTAKMGRD
jgi:hypothetical protein